MNAGLYDAVGTVIGGGTSTCGAAFDDRGAMSVEEYSFRLKYREVVS